MAKACIICVWIVFAIMNIGHLHFNEKQDSSCKKEADENLTLLMNFYAFCYDLYLMV